MGDYRKPWSERGEDAAAVREVARWILRGRRAPAMAGKLSLPWGTLVDVAYRKSRRNVTPKTAGAIWQLALRLGYQGKPLYREASDREVFGVLLERATARYGKREAAAAAWSERFGRSLDGASRAMYRLQRGDIAPSEGVLEEWAWLADMHLEGLRRALRRAIT